MKQGIRLSDSGLRKIVAREKETSSVAPRKRSGRPRSIDAKAASVLYRVARTSRELSLPKLANHLKLRCGLTVSHTIVGRQLKKRGYSRKVALKVPLLTNFAKIKKV